MIVPSCLSFSILQEALRMPVCIHLALALLPCSLAQTIATYKACHRFFFAGFHYPSGRERVCVCVHARAFIFPHLNWTLGPLKGG